jgi:phosphoglycerol transferase MdoB-like AlkP superfamily enzyme
MNEVFVGSLIFVVLVFVLIVLYRIFTPVIDTTYSNLNESGMLGNSTEVNNIISQTRNLWQYAPFALLILFLIYVIYLASKREQYEYGV